jgi:hypothetical protein
MCAIVCAAEQSLDDSTHLVALAGGSKMQFLSYCPQFAYAFTRSLSVSITVVTSQSPTTLSPLVHSQQQTKVATSLVSGLPWILVWSPNCWQSLLRSYPKSLFFQDYWPVIRSFRRLYREFL